MRGILILYASYGIELNQSLYFNRPVINLSNHVLLSLGCWNHVLLSLGCWKCFIHVGVGLM